MNINEDNVPETCNCADESCPEHPGEPYCDMRSAMKVETDDNIFHFCQGCFDAHFKEVAQ